MGSNTYGKVFSVTSFGESHGRCVGVVVDGCPAGLRLDSEDFRETMSRRIPPDPELRSSRVEPDEVELLSGVFEGRTTGAPICALVWNKDVDSQPYEEFRFKPRPGHADYTAWRRYGGYNDYRGGGRFSGRVTLSHLIAGVIALKLLERVGVEVVAYTAEIGGIKAGEMPLEEIKSKVRLSPVSCPDPKASKLMEEYVKKVRSMGDSLGGVVKAVALNVPAGLGEPIFESLESKISSIMYSIPGVKGVEFGAGFLSARMKGSENNDPFTVEKGRIVNLTNNSGGILGGISTGMPIEVSVAFKPPSSIRVKQRTVNLLKMEDASVVVKGRHDPCIVPKAVPVVESSLAIALCDILMEAGLIPRVLDG
ncbi:MAG: chorismate synthase [Candidatus Bathyarchaeia archaeon]